MLPDDLIQAIEAETARVSRQSLQKASAEMTSRYRSPDRDNCDFFLTSESHCLAYLAVRMPATYAVVKRVLNELLISSPQLQIHSIADIGAGPGTATWAAASVFDHLNSAWLIERDGHWIDIGKRLMQQAGNPALNQAKWQQGDLKGSITLPKSDLAILSYVVGELPLKELNALIEQAWQMCRIVAVIEPGTPHGFERIRQVREQLIALGGHMVAPCPHARTCPMSGGNWCHFSERLDRQELHRQVKDVTMGYEDEKYSYVIVSHEAVALPDARILRHPQIHSGHVTLELCAQQGLEKVVVSKRHGALYKQARKADWGNSWPPDT